jgi:hypothetical protein
MKCLFIILLTIVLPSLCHAAMPIDVEHTGDDIVGSNLAYLVKEDIRKSVSLEISFNSKQARMQVDVNTLDRNPQTPGLATVYAVDILWINPTQVFPLYITSNVGYCGADKVQECAMSIVAEISEQSDNIIRLLDSASK